MNSINVNNSNRFQFDSVHNVVPAKTNLKNSRVKQVIMGSLGLIAFGFVAKSFWYDYNTIPLKPPLGTNHSSNTNSSTTSISFLNNTYTYSPYCPLNNTALNSSHAVKPVILGNNFTSVSTKFISNQTIAIKHCSKTIEQNSSIINYPLTLEFPKRIPDASIKIYFSDHINNELIYNKFLLQLEESPTKACKYAEKFIEDELRRPFFQKAFSQILTKNYECASELTNLLIKKDDPFSQTLVQTAFSQFLHMGTSYASVLVENVIETNNFSQDFVKNAFSQILQKDPHAAYNLLINFIDKDDDFSKTFLKDGFTQILKKDSTWASELANIFIGKKDPFSQIMVKHAFDQFLEKDIRLAENYAFKFVGIGKKDSYCQTMAKEAFYQFLKKDTNLACRYAKYFLDKEDHFSKSMAREATDALKIDINLCVSQQPRKKYIQRKQ